jgi:hypothetical protein
VAINIKYKPKTAFIFYNNKNKSLSTSATTGAHLVLVANNDHLGICFTNLFFFVIELEQ